MDRPDFGENWPPGAPGVMIRQPCPLKAGQKRDMPWDMPRFILR